MISRKYEISNKGLQTIKNSMKIHNDELEEGGNAENIVYVFLTEMDCLMNEMFIIL